jgi:type II secretory pathway pseudopilin PulG
MIATHEHECQEGVMSRFACSMTAMTLIELLLVLAVLAALTAMLLPSLSAARERGRRAMCLSNQRQIHAAANVYTIDYSGWVPPGCMPSTGVTRAMTGSGQPYNTTVWYNKYLRIPTSGGRFSRPSGVVWCPSSLRRQTAWPVWVGQWNTSLDYALQGCGYTGDQDSTPTRASKLWGGNLQWGPRIFSMDIAVLSCGLGGGLDLNTFTAHWNKNARAPDGANVVSTDGAGRWVPISQCTTNGGRNNPATGCPAGYWPFGGSYYSAFMMPIQYEMMVRDSYAARGGYEVEGLPYDYFGVNQ